jgi:hypothetical protein
MAKRKMFISYDYDNDRNYKNMLLAWDKTQDSDFGFSDQSADVSTDSTDAAAIKRAISAKINDATYFLCIVGKKTSQSKWVTWEISKAVELNKKIVAVKTESQNTTPLGLLNVGANWAMSFSFESIKKAIESA